MNYDYAIEESFKRNETDDEYWIKAVKCFNIMTGEHYVSITIRKNNHLHHMNEKLNVRVNNFRDAALNLAFDEINMLETAGLM